MHLLNQEMVFALYDKEPAPVFLAGISGFEPSDWSRSLYLTREISDD